MIIEFTIPGKLPSLNEFLAETKRHSRGYYAGNGMKRSAPAFVFRFQEGLDRAFVRDAFFRA